MSVRFFPPTAAPAPAVVRAAWADCVRDGAPPGAVLRPHVERAWRRSLETGCSPHMPRADVLPPAAVAALVGRESRLIEVATPFLAALSRAAGVERHAAMLADDEGRLLKIVADEETMADDDFPHAGALLSEATAGANGVGTTLAEGHYVELVGPEHWIEGFHPFTCQGVPLLGVSGGISGIVSMSVRRVEAANRVRDILFCASEAAECELLAAWLSDAVAGGGLMPQALDSLRQDMIQRITVVRLKLEVAARRIAAGADAAAMIDAAQDLGRRFRRQAATWRALVEEAVSVPEPLRLDELVADLVELLETEARIARVELQWHRVAPVLVLADRRGLSRRLLDAFLTSLQCAVPGSLLGVAVNRSGHQGEVALTLSHPEGRADTRTVRVEASR